MTKRLSALAAAAATVAAPAAAQSVLDDVVFRPEAKVELRLFPDEPQFDGQLEHLQPSLVFTGEASWRSDDRDTRALFEPYLRLDGEDQERTYFDAREANGSHAVGDWGAFAGVSTVFWGVAEAHNPADVINQTDLSEDIDGDAKLGQPMLRLTWRSQAGSVDLFSLPYFRERAFPGEDGRLRPDPVVAGGRAEFERDGGAWAGDAALRYETRIDDLDLGLHAFYGTSRAPTLEFDASLGRLTPFYAELAQGGVYVIRAGVFDPQAEHLVALGLLAEGGGGAVGHDFSFVDDQNPVAGRFHFGEDVGTEDNRLFASDGADEVPDFHDLIGIEAGGGLVEDEHVGRVQRGKQQRQARLLPTRQAAHFGIGLIGAKPETGQPGAQLGLAFLGALAEQVVKRGFFNPQVIHLMLREKPDPQLV